MTKIFLDTSALVELCFKRGSKKNAIASEIEKCDQLLLSDYVVYEAARGYLRYLILLHNKAISVDRFSEILEYAHNIFRKRHFQGTVMEVLLAFERQLEDDDLVISKSKQLALFRANLRNNIRRGWRKVSTLDAARVSNIGCHSEVMDPELDANGLYHQTPSTAKCGKASNCKLKAFISARKKEFDLVKGTLEESVELDKETSDRIRSIQMLRKNPGGDFDRSDCFRTGDAAIAVESPAEAKLLTTNTKHFRPILRALGKTMMEFSE